MALQKPNIGDILWGNPLNTSLDTLDVEKASNIDLGTLAAIVQALQISVNGIILPQSFIYGFETGVNGDPLVPGNGVLGVQGVVTYSDAAPAHGILGLRRTPGSHGTFTVQNISVLQSSGSVYARVTTAGVNNSIFLSFETSSGVPGGSLSFHTGGLIRVVSPDGTHTEDTINPWVLNQWMRIDWKQIWDGINQRLDFRFYLTDAEGANPDDSISVVWTAPLPEIIRFMKPGDDNAWGFDIDTYRTKNSLDWYQAYNPSDPGSVVHSFDEGVEGDAIPSNSNGVKAVTGNPIYHAASAPPNHGSFGVHIPAAVDGGTLTYSRLNNTAETGSLYVKVNTAGAASTKVVVFEDVGLSRLAAINIGSAMKVSIQNSAGTNKATGTVTVPTGQWIRLDWQDTFNTTDSSFDLEVRLFLTAESNGQPDDTIFYEFTGAEALTATPVNDQIGTPSNDWNYDFDTLRLWSDTDQWPPPFGPAVSVPLPPGVAAWAGDFLQTDGYLTVYSDGTLTSVGIDYSANSDMSSAVSMPDGSPSSSGFNKFHLTSLVAGTQYYYQITDTVSSVRTRTGPVRRFRTLQTVGTPCSISLAVGSCKQTNPAKSAAYDDITTVSVGGGANQVPQAVMRLVDLGDFGYANNLSSDSTTHALNWALNMTDAAHEVVAQKMAKEYIVSDHDDNAGKTKIGNAPNFNDPVTKANIRAWQSIVPARMEDTRQFFQTGATWYPGSRHRATVEGNVRFIYTDIRNLERSDTLSVPTDPQAGKPGHGAATTMLGNSTGGQLDWLKAQLDAAAAARQFVVLFTDSAWNGLSPQEVDGYIKPTFTDKWPTYTFERDLISDYAFNAIGPNMIILHGDSHGMQLDDGLTPKFDISGNRLNDKNGFVVACCGPFNQNLHMHFTNAYDFNYPSGVGDGQTGGADTGPYRTAMQWVYLNLNESSAFNFDVTMIFRDATPHKGGGNPAYATGTPKTVNTFTRTYTT